MIEEGGVEECWVMTVRSMMRVRTRVMYMGRKSECAFGATILLTGQIVVWNRGRG